MARGDLPFAADQFRPIPSALISALPQKRPSRTVAAGKGKNSAKACLFLAANAACLHWEAYMKILGFNGAAAKTGTVAALLSESLRAAAEEIAELGETPNTALIHLVDIVKEFHDGSFTNIPSSLQSTFDSMRTADGFVFATPVHWFNMSALMKCFIDWLTSLEQDTRELEGKVAGVVAHCEEDGGNQAVTSILSPLLHMGMLVPPYCGFFRNKNMAAQSEAGWQMVDHRLVGINVVRLAACVQFNKRGWDTDLKYGKARATAPRLLTSSNRSNRRLSTSVSVSIRDRAQ